MRLLPTSSTVADGLALLQQAQGAAIVLTAVGPAGPDLAMLLEVKNTCDPDYVAESIYRCFGYMHDI